MSILCFEFDLKCNLYGNRLRVSTGIDGDSYICQLNCAPFMFNMDEINSIKSFGIT